jgi:hypothetical protein
MGVAIFLGDIRSRGGRELPVAVWQNDVVTRADVVSSNWNSVVDNALTLNAAIFRRQIAFSRDIVHRNNAA